MTENQAEPKFEPENITNLAGIGTKPEDFEPIKSGDLEYTILGKGAFAFNEKMKSKLNSKVYSIKKIEINNEPLPKSFIRETTFMLKVNNEHILKLYGYFQGVEKIGKLKEIYKNDPKKRYQNDTEDKKMYFLVMDCMSNGTLEEFIKNHHEQKLIIEQELVIKIFKQLLSGLKYLHANQIMHRDIKPDNILLDENNNIKIIDFGISALHRDNLGEGDNQNPLLSNSTRVGRVDFVAPEIFKGGMDFDYKVDIFSLGLTMLCLVSKSHPITFNQKVRKIITNNIDENIYNIYLLNLIKRMILENPLLRPNAGDALEDLNKIEKYIKEPTILNENELNNKMPPENTINLDGIGKRPEDFIPIKSGNINYSILGKGAFGYAEKMKSKLNNKYYAIKRLLVQNDIPKDFIRETTFMLQLNHMNIVRLYGYFQGVEKIDKLKTIYVDSKDKRYQNETKDQKMYFLVLDYMANGSLEKYYLEHQNKGIDIEQNFIIKVFKQILQGLKYLHGNHIMHRDIKLDNILLDENNNVKISDLGISAIYKENNYSEENINSSYSNSALFSNFTRIGPIRFVAPEILAHKKGMQYDFDYKVDIFSLGLSILVLMSKEFPISIVNNTRKIVQDNIKGIYNEYLIKLVKRMILFDRNMRPDAKEALEELNKIETLIKNPDNPDLKDYLDRKNQISSSLTNEVKGGFPPENTTYLNGIGKKPEDFESIEYNNKKYTILGKGNFGYTEKMKSKINNKIYAIKRLLVEKEVSKDFIRETTLMMQLNHRHIVKLYGYFQGMEKIDKLKDIYSDNNRYKNKNEDQKMYFLVLDFMAKGSLENYYLERQPKGIDIEQDFIMKIFKQILEGLKCLHENHIMHRDVKLDNILLDENYNIKISDLGISAVYKENNYNEENNNGSYVNSALYSNFTKVGPTKFAAPEILKHKKGMQNDFSYKVDVFSLGLSMLVLMSKKFPITLTNNTRKIDQNSIKPIYNEYLIKLVKRMIFFDQNERPSSAEALEELNNIDLFIKNPNNQQIKIYLEQRNQAFTPQNQYTIQFTQQPYQYGYGNNPNNNVYGYQPGFNNQTNVNNGIYNNNYGYNNQSIMPNNPQMYGNNNNNIQTMESNLYLANLQFKGPNNTHLYIPENIAPVPQNNLFQQNFINNTLLQNQGLQQNNMINSSKISYQSLGPPKITSLLSVFKILFYCFKDNIDNIIYNLNYFANQNNNNVDNLSRMVINVIKFMGNEPQNGNDISTLNNNIQIVRTQLSNVIKEFGGTEEIPPFEVYQKIYGKLNDQLKILNNFYQVNNLNNISFIPNLDPSYYQSTYQMISNIKKTVMSPISDYFHYTFITTERCPNCSFIHKATVSDWSYVEIDATKTGNLSIILFNNFNKINTSTTDFYNCFRCRCYLAALKNLSFLTRPKFLLFYFKGKNIEDKNLDNIIDISQYCFPNNNYTGPTKYSLFAFVKLNNTDTESNYYAFIKANNIWYLYNTKNLKQSDVTEFDAVYPYIAIYKGEN